MRPSENEQEVRPSTSSSCSSTRAELTGWLAPSRPGGLGSGGRLAAHRAGAAHPRPAMVDPADSQVRPAGGVPGGSHRQPEAGGGRPSPRGAATVRHMDMEGRVGRGRNRERRGWSLRETGRRGAEVTNPGRSPLLELTSRDGRPPVGPEPPAATPGARRGPSCHLHGQPGGAGGTSQRPIRASYDDGGRRLEGASRAGGREQACPLTVGPVPLRPGRQRAGRLARQGGRSSPAGRHRTGRPIRPPSGVQDGARPHSLPLHRTPVSSIPLWTRIGPLRTRKPTPELHPTASDSSELHSTADSPETRRRRRPYRGGRLHRKPAAAGLVLDNGEDEPPAFRDRPGPPLSIGCASAEGGPVVCLCPVSTSHRAEAGHRVPTV